MYQDIWTNGSFGLKGNFQSLTTLGKSVARGSSVRPPGLTARLTARTAGRTARTAGRPDGTDGRPDGPVGPPNGPDGPPNGPDSPPNGPDGPPYDPDGGAGDRRLRPWYLTRGWIMSHLYMQFGINTVKGRKKVIAFPQNKRIREAIN